MDASDAATRLRAYLLWSVLAGLAFFAVYPTTNWITSMRGTTLRLWLPAELAIPFMPGFIWAYLSMYLLFVMPLVFVPATAMPALGKQLIAGCVVSGVLFLLLPAELGFVRRIPEAQSAIYAGMFSVDRPYNLVPSLHVIWSAAIVLACADFARPAMRAVLLVWFCVIVASTVLVHQHHLLDVIAALAIVVVLRRQHEVRHA